MNKTPKFSSKLLALLPLAFFGIAILQWGGCKGPCHDIDCKNGGICINGDCDCPVGFDGPDCGNEKVPDNIRITKITYTKIPLTHEDGTTWDAGPLPGANPGLYVIVYRDSDPSANNENWVQVWNSDDDFGYYNNADPSQQQVFVPSIPVLLSSPEQKYRISLYDEDGTDDELIGGITFVPYTSGQSHPSTVIQESTKVRFVLDATYDF